MLNLPQALQLFKPKDLDAQRFLPPIERSVTSVLTYLRTTFDDAANGGMRILKPLLLKTLNIDNDLKVGGTATAQNVTVNNTLTTYNRAQIRAGLDTPSGIKTTIGPFGYTGNPAAGAYYSMGVPFFTTNALYSPPYRGSVVGASIVTYSSTATTFSTFITGVSPTEYRYDIPIGAGATVAVNFTLPRGSYYFESNYNIVCKFYSPVNASNVSFYLSPVVEFST